ncbi:MAG TPA: DUF4157 domain-containing protein [Allosphingosinicella sp.]
MAEYLERASESRGKRDEPRPTGIFRHEALQRRAEAREAGGTAALNARAPGPMPVQGGTRANRGGLPDNLKAGVENLSGMSLDGVKVHYNSSRPAELNALAYAQGRDIHVGPGQEHHLPHETWHIVQQAQGRVKPTMQMKEGVSVNDDQGLEREADVMGAKALRHGAQAAQDMVSAPATVAGTAQMKTASGHAKGCGCSGCAPRAAVGGPTVQAKMSGLGSGVVQLKACSLCGYEKGHAPSCTPEKRAAAVAAKKAANTEAADQSMDNRTRRDQSHPHHGNKNIKKAWKK